VQLRTKDPETLAARARFHSPVEDVLGILSGTLLAALGAHLLHAAELVTGGVAGLALLIAYAGGPPFPIAFALVNLPFFVLAWRRRGWVFTLRSLLCVGLVSGFAAVLGPLMGPVHPHPALALVLGNLLAAVGILMLFRHGGSLGGSGILALVVQDRWGVPAGWTILVFDALVVLASLAVSGWSTVLLSALGAALLGVVIALNHRPGRYAVAA